MEPEQTTLETEKTSTQTTNLLVSKCQLTRGCNIIMLVGGVSHPIPIKVYSKVQALMAAENVALLGSKRINIISCKTAIARIHWPPWNIATQLVRVTTFKWDGGMRCNHPRLKSVIKTNLMLYTCKKWATYHISIQLSARQCRDSPFVYIYIYIF